MVTPLFRFNCTIPYCMSSLCFVYADRTFSIVTVFVIIGSVLLVIREWYTQVCESILLQTDFVAYFLTLGYIPDQSTLAPAYCAPPAYGLQNMAVEKPQLHHQHQYKQQQNQQHVSSSGGNKSIPTYTVTSTPPCVQVSQLLQKKLDGSWYWFKKFQVLS